MKRPVLVDTNVVVSGLLDRDGDAPTARVLNAMLAGRLPFLLSVELLAEYRSVLLRPRIRTRHGLSEAEVDEILTVLAANAVVREVPSTTSPAAPDPGDQHLWSLLFNSPGTILVTGDRALLQRPPEQASVISPRSLLDMWVEAGGQKDE